MDTKEEDTTRTPKKQNIEKGGKQIVQGTKSKGKKKQMKRKGLAFEIQEYTSDKIPKGATNKYKSKT